MNNPCNKLGSNCRWRSGAKRMTGKELCVHDLSSLMQFGRASSCCVYYSPSRGMQKAAHRANAKLVVIGTHSTGVNKQRMRARLKGKTKYRLGIVDVAHHLVKVIRDGQDRRPVRCTLQLWCVTSASMWRAPSGGGRWTARTV